MEVIKGSEGLGRNFGGDEARYPEMEQGRWWEEIPRRVLGKSCLLIKQGWGGGQGGGSHC